MTKNALLSTRSMMFKRLKTVFERLDLRFAGNSDYLLFENERFLFRLENVDKEKDWCLKVSACPRSVFDRWGNSRHFSFVVFLKHGRGVKEKNLRNRFLKYDELRSRVGWYVKKVRAVTSMLPRHFFTLGFHVEV